MRKLLVVAAFAVACACACELSHANDLFIGTISVRDGEVVLERCDLARNTYRLNDANGVDAVEAIRNMPPAAKGYWYAEVIGEYVEIDGQDGLDVALIENLRADESCHLLDALEAMPSKGESD